MHLLENVYFWNLFRKSLDLTAGLYRKRLELMKNFGIDRSVSILDVGCGTGQYSQITAGDYLGIDMDPRYIAAAQQRYGSPQKRFQCVRLQEANLQSKQFDITLLMDATHHLSDADLEDLLLVLQSVTRRYLVITDPVRQNPLNWWGRFLTYCDRGNHIREKNEEIRLIGRHFSVIQRIESTFLGVKNIMLFAKPL